MCDDILALCQTILLLDKAHRFLRPYLDPNCLQRSNVATMSHRLVANNWRCHRRCESAVILYLRKIDEFSLISQAMQVKCFPDIVSSFFVLKKTSLYTCMHLQFSFFFKEIHPFDYFDFPHGNHQHAIVIEEK